MKHHYIATLPWKLSFKATQFEIPWEQDGQLSPKGFVWTILDDGVQRVWKPFQKAESRVNRLCSKQCWIMTMKTWTAIIVFFLGHLEMLLSAWSYIFKFKFGDSPFFDILVYVELNHSWIIQSYYDYLPSLLFNCHWKPHKNFRSRFLPVPKSSSFFRGQPVGCLGMGSHSGGGPKGWRFSGSVSARLFLWSEIRYEQWRNTGGL